MGAVLAGAQQAGAAVTESDFLDDLPVVLSASRLSQPVSEAPVAVTVIDQEMIHASGFRDIPDLLRLVPGFSVAYTRDNTWAAGYHGLGDAFSRRFQVLVDGRSIYSPHYGAVNWTDLPLSIDDIERIEVVRGPDAAIYGANAFAAVINIITKMAAQVPGEFVSLQIGEQGMRGATVRHGGGDGALRYRLTASTQQRDRFERDITNKIADGAGDNGQYYESSKTSFLNGRMDWQLSANSDAMAQFGLSQGNWNAGRSVVSPTAILEPQQQDARAMYLQLAYHKVESVRREWRLQAYYAQNRFDANAQADLTALGIGAVNVDQYLLQTRSNIELQVNEQWRPNLRGVWGGEVRQETVTSPQNYNSGRQWSGNLARVFGNLEWRPHERVLLQGGAMLEHHYFTGIDVSPRVAANFTLTPGHVIRLGISRAYRSPTFFEEKGNQVYVLQSGTVADVVTVPSDGLAPERVLSREIAYVGFWRPARLEMDVRLFQDKIDDFIGQDKYDFDPSDDGGIRPNEFKYANIGSARSHGGELQLRWRPVHALDLSAHYSRVFLEAHFGGAGIHNVINFNKDVPVSAPRNTWGLLASYRLDHGWETSMGVWRSDAMKWLSEGDLTAAYNRMDLRVTRRWKWQGRDIEASVVGQSLLGNYQEFRDTNIFSRRVYGSLSLGW
ncbi:TonB-dependent receptor [Thiobacillus sp.]|jgi:iron complex outermembrane receptor protein|uniref:TonB-dependent receptor plug domain-containing protein n=1 Tax=Thiobacillus sp. TaxID=924 RepID=UPI0025D1CC17|nr:TonB-dependent receptor [Thiobacillus sp.]